MSLRDSRQDRGQTRSLKRDRLFSLRSSSIFGATPPGTTPTGGLLSLTIADTTPIDVLSSIGASGNGWVAICVLKGLTSLVGTVVPSQLTLTVTDPGYDTSGNTTTVTRTITGVANMRRQYPNGATKMISTDSTDLTLYITLDDWIYSNTTITAASIGATFYTSCVAGAAASKTNLSTLAYTKPLFGWIAPQEERQTGSTHAVEAVAFHRHATSGQQVACVKYNVTDGNTTTSDVLVSAPTLSSKITQGFIPEVWAGTVDFSTMVAQTMCSVSAKVYPWIGNSSAVLDLASDGRSWPTALPRTKLRVYCDSDGKYGGVHAFIDGVGAAPAVSTTEATARGTPYATLAAAMVGAAAFNNLGTGGRPAHNDVGGAIFQFKDNAGGAKTYTISAASTPAGGTAPYTVQRDSASSAVVTIKWAVAGPWTQPNNAIWKNLTIDASGGDDYCIVGPNTATSKLTLNTCTIDNTSNKQNVTWYAYKYIMNCTGLGSAIVKLNGLPRADDATPLLAGWLDTSTTAKPAVRDAKLTIGNSMVKYSYRQDENTGGSSEGDHGKIFYNNRVMSGSMINTSATTINEGVAFVQNLVEYDGSDGSVAVMSNFADSDNTTITNYIDMYNTCVGERSSRMYNDNTTGDVVPSGTIKMGVSKYSVYDNFNCKSDPHRATVGGSVGNWSYRYGVGNAYLMSLFGDVSRNAGSHAHNDNSDSPFLGDAWLTTSQDNLRSTLASNAATMAKFTNYTVDPQGVPALGGTYTPISSATEFQIVPAGKGGLLKDLAGTTRITSGTGAIGAYEHA